MALSNHLASRLEETVRRLTADVYRITWLQDVQLFDDLEHDIGDIADAVLPFAGDTTDINIGEIVIGAALTGRNADLGRSRMIVDLDPEAAE